LTSRLEQVIINSSPFEVLAMAIPTGEIVARPMVARACGCLKEFQHYAVDRYRAQRLAKFQKTRCPECVAKFEEEQRKAAEALPNKGEMFQLLPPNAQLIMNKRPDGKWSGKLVVGGATIEALADAPQGLAFTLARQLHAAQQAQKK
jgi:hypothetical protein